MLPGRCHKYQFLYHFLIVFEVVLPDLVLIATLCGECTEHLVNLSGSCGSSVLIKLWSKHLVGGAVPSRDTTECHASDFTPELSPTNIYK